jgi:hypothetical protein
MNVKLAFFLLFIACITGCTAPQIQTIWKPENSTSVTGNKVLIAVVLPNNDTLLRKKIEDQTCADLRKLGYDAVSPSEEFGLHGLSRLEQEETYLALCEHGIDVVMTLALLDKNTETPYVKSLMHNYSALSFYNRIWSYKRFHVQQHVTGSAHDKKLFFETFLFDLKVLQPIYVIRTASIAPGSSANVYAEYAKGIISHMVKKKVIRKKPTPKAA